MQHRAMWHNIFTDDDLTEVKITCSCQKYETAWCATEDDARERWWQHTLAMLRIPYTGKD